MSLYATNEIDGTQLKEIDERDICLHLSVHVQRFRVLDGYRAFEHFKGLKIVSGEKIQMTLRVLHPSVVALHDAHLPHG
jgi:hypothetical protein